MSTAIGVHMLRRKIRFFLVPVLVMSLIFIVYQVLIFVELDKNSKRSLDRLQGVHEQLSRFYTPNEHGKFVCIHTFDAIDFDQVNDDYCDCADGSDEPATNACANGEFYCRNQASFHNYPKRLPSSRVNDGVCDCCDGSDEWKSRAPTVALSHELQAMLQRFHPPCPLLC